MGLALAILGSLAFTFTNGFHDSSNAVAALVATRAATPGQAVVLAGLFNAAGPLLLGTAVADTVGGIVAAPSGRALPVVAGAVVAGLVWNLLTWSRGLPSSSSHALVGGLVGAGLVEGGWGTVRWGGMAGVRPAGVIGVLVALAVSPVLGFGAGYVLERCGRRLFRGARRGAVRAIRRAEWVTASALALSHGANDAQKSMGVITLLLVAGGHLRGFHVPLWVVLVSAAALTAGTTFGGWRIVRTVGSGIYRIRALDGLVSQASSAGVILAAASVGGPVSTTHVVASSVMGLGAGRRWRRVRWTVAAQIVLAWFVTLPASAAIAALAVLVGKALGML